MKNTFKPFDPAEYLDTPEAAAVFLSDALETRDAKYIAKALGVLARANGMTAVAKETGLSREQLYRTLSDDAQGGNPTLQSFLAVLGAVGVDLYAQPQKAT